MIGKTLGHYQISSQLGKGGMGEVYQAKDQKLGRDVAIKVLSEEFARDADRVSRFQREAKLLASLNHPNIAAIYGLEESGGTNFLVLELVEGDTLADQIKRGPISVEEALKLALQIAEALEAAHEKGVIHRDLKPANIKVTPEGKVKVLDFGLAKAFTGEQENLNLSNSPTLSNAATQQGVILGTAAYMSPEQARGKPVDKRTDIWAFGCLLFEMLSGRVAFRGEDVSEILASVIKGDVQLELLPANLHPRVREVIIRCLQKDLKKRYSIISDAKYEIEQALADPGGAVVQPFSAAQARTRLRTILPWVAASIVFGAIIAAVAVWKWKPSEPARVMRFYDLPKDRPAGDAAVLPFLALSADGRQLAYATAKGMYWRSVDAFEQKLIVGGETGPENPFFSPDGQWIGYLSNTERKLKKIAINGGAPVPLCDVLTVVGATWGADNHIVYGTQDKGIMRVSANGGRPEQIVKPAQNEWLCHPQMLPDGKSVLFTRVLPAPYKVMIQSLKSGERKELFEGDTARYLPTGHIVYAIENNLFAVPFDSGRLELAGGSVRIIENVFRLDVYAPQYAVSDSGTLVYAPDTAGVADPNAARRTLVWVNRKGKEVPIATAANYESPNISPDGSKLAIGILGANKGDIYIWDFARETMSRLTFNQSSWRPLWSRDGKRIVFQFGAIGKRTIGSKAADGTGNEELLVSEHAQVEMAPSSWAKDMRTLVLTENSGYGTAIRALSLEGNRSLKTLINLASQPKISLDGHWMAYTSIQSGKFEVFVRPFPEIDKGTWQVSVNGGGDPLWSPNGRELFYRNGDFVMTAAVQTEGAFGTGKTEILFEGKYVDSSWDISPDGKRFLMVKEAGSNTTEAGVQLNVIVNWTEELKQRVPVK